MSPEIWGECAWDFIHYVTMTYPEHPTDIDKNNYYYYFQMLQYVLPCKKCSRNMTQHLKKYPITDEVLSSRSNMVKWGIDLHNIVNYYTGKPMLTYDEAMNEINKKINRKKTNNNILYYLLLIVAFLIVIFMAYYYLFGRHK